METETTTFQVSLFKWGYGELQLNKRPLWATSYSLSFVWNWPRQEPLFDLDAEQVLTQAASQGISVPPLIYEVENVMRDFKPYLIRDVISHDRLEIHQQIHRCWQSVLSEFHFSDKCAESI